jgi:DNA-binding transcriptional LysR family regulator
MDIRNVDLNLLPMLDALLRHRSVTLAARELDMSQSALSAALARLRVLLDDPLFVRTGRGLEPTTRAAELAGPVAAVLEQVRERVLRATAFDPATSRRRFRVMLSDVGAYVLWPRLLRAVRARAPTATIGMRPAAGADIAAELLEGGVDLAIGAYPGIAGSLMQRRLFERRFVALVRAGHRLAGRRPTLRAFCDAPQAAVPGASGVQARIDRLLAERGLRRTDIVEVPSYLMLPALLESSDYLAVVPGQLAEAFARRGALEVLPLPFALPASVIRMHWHRRFHRDPANAWLRALVAQELAAR